MPKRDDLVNTMQAWIDARRETLLRIASTNRHALLNLDASMEMLHQAYEAGAKALRDEDKRNGRRR